MIFLCMIELYSCYILILLYSKEHFEPDLRVVAPTQQVLGFFFKQNCQKWAHFGHKKAGEQPKIEKIKEYLRFMLFRYQPTKKNCELLILRKKLKSIVHIFKMLEKLWLWTGQMITDGTFLWGGLHSNLTISPVLIKTLETCSHLD